MKFHVTINNKLQFRLQSLWIHIANRTVPKINFKEFCEEGSSFVQRMNYAKRKFENKFITGRYPNNHRMCKKSILTNVNKIYGRKVFELKFFKRNFFYMKEILQLKSDL